MGSRGASAGSAGNSIGGNGAIASATRTANKAVDEFLSQNGGMASDGEINGVYERTFITEAIKLGANKTAINNGLNEALRTNDIDYVGNNYNRINVVDFAPKDRARVSAVLNEGAKFGG